LASKQLKSENVVSLISQLKREIELHLFNESESKIENVELSIVLPIYNEEENIPELFTRLVQVIKSVRSAEIIFVNDGSRDSSVELITQLHNQDSRVKLINLSRNFGHQAAITAGIDYSSGNAVVLMDADLQDPPEVLNRMIEIWREGAEVVYAVRQKRKEPVWKKTAYFAFYRLLKLIANIEIPLDSGDFCLMDRKVIQQLKAMPERNRFLRGLRSWVGFKQVALPYERQARFAGKAKYTVRKLMSLALNGILSFSSFPLRMAVYTGLVTCSLAMIFLLYAIGGYLFINQTPQGWTSLIVVVLLVGGVQLILLGAIGEYIARIYDEVKQRPSYIVREYLN
jgi:dolichol-phosphate mannosyltransferase